MLDDLVETIRTLQKRIKEHGSHIGAYESRTRVTLINPMLSALGWDVDDPGVVEIEPKTDEGWADYALLGSNGKPVIFVEAKKLTENVNPHAKQSVNYAVGENLNRSPKIQYCALTNGDVWQVFDVLSQDLILETLVLSPDPAKSALKFLGLWRQSLRDGGFDTAVEPLVEVKKEAAPEPIPQVVVRPTPQPTPTQSVVQSPASLGGAWTPLTGDFGITKRPAPTAIRLPNGEERDIKYWRDIVIESVRWLDERGLLTHEERQFRSGHKRYLFNTNGIHPNGGEFNGPIPLSGTGIVVEGNISATLIVRSVRRLMQHFGQDPSQVYLKLP